MQSTLSLPQTVLVDLYPFVILRLKNQPLCTSLTIYPKWIQSHSYGKPLNKPSWHELTTTVNKRSAELKGRRRVNTFTTIFFSWTYSLSQYEDE